jgi:hypothetical protein
MTETITHYTTLTDTIAVELELTELEQLNLKVAAIAGWTDIEEWNPNPKCPKVKKVFQGINKNRRELGIFVPDYVNDLNAIYRLFLGFGITVTLVHDAEDATHFAVSGIRSGGMHSSPAIALCKLLIELSSEPQVQVIDDDGDIEPKVIEASFA